MDAQRTFITDAAGQPFDLLSGADVLFQSPQMALLDRIDAVGLAPDDPGSNTDASAEAGTTGPAGGANGSVDSNGNAGPSGLMSALNAEGLVTVGDLGQPGAGIVPAVSGLANPDMPSALEPLNNVLSGGAAGPGGTANVPGNAVGLENNAVLDFHQYLEGVGDTLGIAYGVHGLTSTGETIGLGKVGMSNLVTDALSPAAPLGLPTGDGSIGHIPSDIAPIVEAAGGIVTGLGHDLVSPFGGSYLQAVEAGHGIGINPIIDVANALSNETATFLQNIGTHLGTPTIASGIDNIVATVGLGNIGGQTPNGATSLLTDVANATGLVPGAGAQQSLDHIPVDVTHVVASITSLPSAVAADLPLDHGGFLSGTLGATPVAAIGATAGGLLGGAAGTLADPLTYVTSVAGGALDTVVPHLAATVASLATDTGANSGQSGPVGSLDGLVAGVVAPVLHDVGSVLTGIGPIAAGGGSPTDIVSTVTHAVDPVLGGSPAAPTDIVSTVTHAADPVLGGSPAAPIDVVSAVANAAGPVLGGSPAAPTDIVSTVTHAVDQASGGSALGTVAASGVFHAVVTADTHDAATPSSSAADGLVGTLTAVVTGASSAAPAAPDEPAAHAATPDPSADLSHVIATATHATPDTHGLLHI